MGLYDIIRRSVLPFAMAASLSCGEKKQTLEDLGIYVTPDTSEVMREEVDGVDIFYAKDKVLIKSAESRSSLEELARNYGGEITGYIEPLQWYELRVPDARKVLPHIEKSPLVEEAELNYAGTTEELDIEQKPVGDAVWGYHKIKLGEAYQFIGDRDLEETTVAVIDIGFDLRHPELDSRFLPGIDLGSNDDNPTYGDIPESVLGTDTHRDHGTKVTGIIAAENNGTGFNGVTYNSRILPIKVFNSSRAGLFADDVLPDAYFSFKVAAGIYYATEMDADVINISLGWYTYSPLPNRILHSAAEFAASKDVSLIAAAGNEHRDASFIYPASVPEVLSVGATTNDDERADFSNYSRDKEFSELSFAAPGVAVGTTDAGGGLTSRARGTSFSAPFVSGLDALIKSLDSSLTPTQRRQIMLRSSDMIQVAYPGDDSGTHIWQRINAYNAVVLAVTGCLPSEKDCKPGMEGEAEGEHDVWLPMSTEGAPEPRTGHTAVWTGSEMIVWGGRGTKGQGLTDGKRYDPDTNSWSDMSMRNAPMPRSGETAIWTGSEMVIFGGSVPGTTVQDPTRLADGGKYNPMRDEWLPITMASRGRWGHTSVWTGTEMIVWGQYNISDADNTGERYNPSEDNWEPITTVNAPEERRGAHSAIWTGSEMIIFGGQNHLIISATGGKYDPHLNRWEPISPSVEGRGAHSAIWTGSEMIVWGGDTSDILTETGSYKLPSYGLIYNPITNNWAYTSMESSSEGMRWGYPNLVWTGSEMMMWGSSLDVSSYGVRYNPTTDTWVLVPTENAPQARKGHTAIWTGSEMIVWGGDGKEGNIRDYLNTGARYRP